MNKEVDFTIGMFSKTANRNRNMLSSVTYYLSPFIMVIPPGREYSALDNLFRPFAWQVWIVLVAMTLTAVTTVLCIKRSSSKHVQSLLIGHNNRNPIMNLYQVILGSPTAYLPRGDFARYILMMFMLFWFVNRTMYQGFLFEFLQSNAREPEVKTISEMIKRKFLFYMVSSAQENVKYIPEIVERWVKQLENR